MVTRTQSSPVPVSSKFFRVIEALLNEFKLTICSDDGSGTVGVLNVALALANYGVNNAVRFAFWGAEEYGKLGSYYYIKQINSSSTELSKIRAYLNFDMVCVFWFSILQFV